MKKTIISMVTAATLLIPTGALAAGTYTVKSGDTMWKIAVKTQTGTQELINANPSLKNPNLIYPGQVLTVPTKVNATTEAKVVELVNAERAKAGLKPLVSNWELARVAKIKAQDMTDKNYFSHTSPTYGDPFTMIKNFGIKYTAAGENIAQGQKTPQEVMNAWMNSSGHKANIMSSTYNQIGVGYDARSNTWVQQFIKN